MFKAAKPQVSDKSHDCDTLLRNYYSMQNKYNVKVLSDAITRYKLF